jgi:DNA (cytosine-5)-methyltransferase 1
VTAPLTLGSLFDGIGGFPLAGVRQGFTPVWASEIEPFPMEVTKIRFPDMLPVGDIMKLKGSELTPVDVVCGGSPCQDLSVANGRRLGLQGERSGLFMEQIRIIKEMRAYDKASGRTADAVRPRYMVWENVPGAFSCSGGEDFRAVLEETCRVADNSVSVPRPPGGVWQSAGAILGDQFSAAWRVYDAQYWNVPQRRKRIFLVADFGGHTASQILFEQDCLPGNSAAGEEARQGAAPGAETGAGASGGNPAGGCLTSWDTQQERVFTEESVAPTLAGADGGGGRNPGGLLFTAAFSAGAGSSAGGIGYQEECAPTLKATASGSMMPSVLCLNDQGGSRMDVSEGVTATLRSQEHGHSPLVMGSQPELFENYGIDSRYTGPYKVAPTMSARYGTGGNNVPLISQPSVFLADSGEDSAPTETYCIAGNIIDRQDKNGGNGIGVQPDISYTVTATDRHCVFSQQRSDEYAPNEVVSTQSARQYKDATDLVCETNQAGAPEPRGASTEPHVRPHCVCRLIRRLTPLECERLQGFPDHWTDIPGASDSARYKALGNSVAIPCVEHVLRGVAYFLRKFKEEPSCTSIRTT